MQRLRHTRFEVTKRHYIHNNPYLKKEKHKVYRKRSRKKTHMDTLNEIPLADLEHWLSDRLNVEPAIINSIRRKHKKASSNSIVDVSDNNNVIFLPEDEVLERVKHLDISRYSLRKYSFEKGACQTDSNDYRYGKRFRYKEAFIDDLAQGWIQAEALKSKMKLPHATFYRRFKAENWRVARIGKSLYVRKSDCV